MKCTNCNKDIPDDLAETIAGFIRELDSVQYGVCSGCLKYLIAFGLSKRNLYDLVAVKHHSVYRGG